jgi:hypothetical protein
MAEIRVREDEKEMDAMNKVRKKREFNKMGDPNTNE